MKKTSMANKILLLLVLFALTFSMIFSGCSSAPATSEAPADTAEDAAEDTADEASGEAVTLTWFNHNDSDTKQAWMQFCVDKLNETNPEIEVIIETVGYDSYVQLLKTKIAGDDVPDIFDLTTRSDILDFVESGYVADLTSEPFMANITESGTDNCNVDGAIYGALPEVTMKVVTYNKTMFDERGYEVPTTLDEFYAICDDLLADGIYPLAYGLADGWPIWATFDIDSIPTLFMDDLESDALRMSGELTYVGDENFYGLMERTRERYMYAQPDPFGTDQDTVRNMIAQGEIAMIAGGSWELGDISKKTSDIELGFFALPRTNNPEETVITIQGQGGYMIAEQSENKEAALKLYEIMFSEESMLFYQDQVGAISTYKDLPTDGSNPAFEYANEMLSAGMSFSNSNMMSSMPSAFGDFQADQMAAFLMDDSITVEELAQNYDEELARLMENE